MSLVNANKPEENLVELEVSITKEAFDAATDRVYKRNAPKITVQGFRKGKAPRNIIEKMYGKGVFYEEALNDIIPAAFEEALKESGESAVSRPEFDVVSIDENGVLFKAKFYVKPEVKLGSYKGLTAEKVVREASDEDVDMEIDRTRNRNSRMIDITDRAAQTGDTAIIDFEGFVDGAAFEGGKGEKYNLKLGSGSFIPGFEDQVVGHNIGDSFDVNVTFPSDYGKEDLAGKDATFKVVLHQIQMTELPELDDEFAKDVSEFDTLDEYKADIKAKIQKRNDDAAAHATEEQIIDALLANVDVNIPAPMIDNEAENIIRDRDYSLRSQGLSLDMYFKYTGMNLDSMREQVRPQAERQVKTRLALEKIIELENIVAEEADINAEFERLGAAYNMELDKVKEAVAPDALASDVKIRKAVDFVRSNAVITEKAAAPQEAKDAE